MSNKGRRLLTEREGKKLLAYKDSVGIWTIGVGHTAAAGPPSPKKGMRITENECDQILTRDLVSFSDQIEKLVTVLLTQYEFDALLSLAFNIGIGGFKRSSVLKYLNVGNRRVAADKFLLWNKGGKPKRVIKGLTNRRKAERLQFLNG